MRPSPQLSRPVYLPPSMSQGSPTSASPISGTQMLMPQGSPGASDTAVHFWSAGQSWTIGSHWPDTPPSGGCKKLPVSVPGAVGSLVPVVGLVCEALEVSPAVALSASVALLADPVLPVAPPLVSPALAVGFSPGDLSAQAASHRPNRMIEGERSMRMKRSFSAAP